jgi:peptide/nickel transport system substrate-binding protein
VQLAKAIRVVAHKEETVMRSKAARLHPLLVLLAVAMTSILFVVACGGGGEATSAPEVMEDTDGDEVAEVMEETEDTEEAMAPGEPKRGGTLTMAMYTEHTTLDPPVVGLSVMDIAITQATYDNLLMIQPDLTVKPELATHWEANDDLTSYTFYLREGVKFHHGKDFKAEDVVSTFARIQDPVLDVPIRTTFEVVTDVVALDDYTVRFDLVGSNSFFPDSLSIYQVRIIPSDIDPERFHTEVIGTGPFMLEEHLPGERTTMVRNPDYWEEGKPYLDELVIVNIPEPATRSNALQNGDIDILYRMESQSAPAIEAHPDTVVLELASPGIRGVDMDIRVPPFDNKLVRKAIQAATDREAIRQAAFLGRGGIAYDHIFPAYDPRYDPQYNPPAYDPELARSLLAQAGYPDGIDLTLHTSTASPGLLELAVALKESAAPAGININVERRPEDIYWDDVWMVEPFTVVSWFGRANVDQALSIQYHSESSWNAPRYFNDELDMLIERARGETLEEQLVTYARIQEILVDDVPRLVTTFVPTLWGARNDVRGVTPHPLDWGLIQDAWFDR